VTPARTRTGYAESLPKTPTTDDEVEQQYLLALYWARREDHDGRDGYCNRCHVSKCPPWEEAYYYTTFQSRRRFPPMAEDHRSKFVPRT